MLAEQIALEEHSCTLYANIVSYSQQTGSGIT